MSFVEKEVEIRQRIDITKSFVKQPIQQQTKRGNFQGSDKREDKGNEKRDGVSTLSNFFVGDKARCAFCERSNHESGDCFRAQNMSMDEKIKILKAKGLCFRCCGKHMGKDCRERVECLICRRKHLTVLCRDFKVNRDSSGPPTKRQKTETATIGSERTNHNQEVRSQGEQRSTASHSNFECSKEVALQTIIVTIVNGKKEEKVRAFLDSGSQRSYILKSIAHKLDLKPVGVEQVVHSLFGGQQTSNMTHHKYILKTKSVETSYQLEAEFRECEQLCDRIPQVGRDDSLMAELKKKGVILNDAGSHSQKIGMLIGADIYATILTGKVVHLSGGGAAIQTKLGWTVLGNVAVANSTKEGSMANLCLTMSVTDVCVTQLWELETIGIRDKCEELSVSKRAHEEILNFEKNISRSENGMYSVMLPWKEELPFLPSNRDVAFKRLESATRKLIKLKLFETYDSIFKDWEKEGFIERVHQESSNTKMHYLPHRPHVKPESLTTPVRPVFDASCRVGKCASLNDCLKKGENLIQKIPKLINLFRQGKVGFVADIRKAFQMIGVDENDRDCLRFLWWLNEDMNEVIEFRHASVVFGVVCSPFILGAVLNFHLRNLAEDEKEIGLKLLSRLYVDNVVSSEDTIDEYYQFRNLAVELLTRAKMDLRMWQSNKDDNIEEEVRVISVLGVQWDRKADELFINTKNIMHPDKVTKRIILSMIQKLFDPMGFICPALLPMKIILQRAWKNKLRWDEELTDLESRQFKRWCEEATKLSEMRIPRMMTNGLKDRSLWSLHTFSDACKNAYAAIVFLRVEEDKYVSVQLVSARSRVSPVRTLTIPKLELMGCLVGARLAASVKTALELQDIREYYWSDSTTALAWICRNDQWGTFVANRTRDITNLTKSTDWRHVPGTENPADLPSRGCSPLSLIRSRWFEGPAWLYQPEEEWPCTIEVADENEIFAEKRTTGVVTEISCLSITKFIRNQHTFPQLIRIMGWVRRFLYNKFVQDKSKRRSGPLNEKELYKAELVLIREIQREEFPEEKEDNLKALEIFKDDWGILRVKTRLTYRNLPEDFKYPMVLPRKRPEVRQLINDTHWDYCHAGAGFITTHLRSRYWILKARHAVRSVISKCPRCRKLVSKAMIPEAAPLPLDRVKDAEVFEVVGIDLAGPLILKNGNKVWLVIFTCAVFRAVHFELVGSLSSRAFIASLGNFIKKYRRPSVIYSDNGTNFRGAENLFKTFDWDIIVKDELVCKIDWKFNPVTAAWWGGWWERLIRTAKELLRRTIGKGSVNRKELEAVIATVKEVMNGRPLTYISENSRDLEPLTPSLFLHPYGSIQFPEGDLSEAQRIRFRYNYVTTLRKELKNRFLREYLSMLVNRNTKKPSRLLKVGELVWISCDNMKRIEWPMGRVLELIPGADGVCRLARLKTEKGEMIRALQRLYPMEMDNDCQLERSIRANGTRTRYGRQVRTPQRFE